MFAIVAAAGSALRLNKIKKQFLKINGRFVLEICVEKFVLAGVLKIVVATKKEDVEFAKKILARFKKYIVFVEGADTRQKTVKKAFLAEYLNHEKTDLVLIHDAARPFFEVEKLKFLIKVAKIKKAACFCCRIVDTVKKLKNSEIEKTLNRDELVLAQTPQAFEIDLYKKALELNQKQKKYVTDDCQLIERLNHKIAPIFCEKTNFKITTMEDLTYLEFLTQHKKEIF